MNDALITLAVTCFKEGDFLRECWESILQQTDSRWEVVLVKDGGSDEDTDRVFLGLEHPNLKKIALVKNVGPYPARNLAFSLAQTKYVMPLDADDMLPPNSIKAVLETFHRKNCDYVFGDFKFIGEKDGVVKFVSPPFPKKYIYTNHFPGWTAIRRSIWEDIGGYSIELSDGYADFDFFLSMVEKGYVGKHCGEVYYFYRSWSKTQVSGSYRTRFFQKRSLIVGRHPTLFKRGIFRNRFLGYGALFDALGHAANSEVLDARKKAAMSIFLGCIERPILYYIFLFGTLPTSKISNFLGRLFSLTLKKLIKKLDI